MTSSESINYSKYSKINQQNINLSTDLELIEQKNDNQEQKIKEKELSQILLLPNEDESEKGNEIDDVKLQKNWRQSTEPSYQVSANNYLYGNPIDNLNPKYLGKCYAFLYDFKGNPKLTIGPDCK